MIPRDSLPESVLKQIKPKNIQYYVRTMGWKKIDKTSDRIAVYRLPNTNKELIVPRDVELTDYSRRISDIIQTLAAVEGRRPEDIISDLIVASPSDVVRFRIDGPATKDGTIPIEAGIGLIEGAKKALLSSACTVIDPQKFHPRLSRAEAEDFISNCRIGQTEHGSFIARFICPFALPMPESQLRLFETENSKNTFTRKVTTMLMESVNLISTSIVAEDENRIINPELNDPVISANICEALLEMEPSDDETELEVGVSWAGEKHPNASIPESIRIPKRYFRTIEWAANELRPSEVTGVRKFIGKIYKLSGSARSETDPETPHQSEAYIAFQDGEELLRARMNLTGEFHRIACNAFRDGDFVKVEGKLKRSARVGLIEDPHGLESITEPKN